MGKQELWDKPHAMARVVALGGSDAELLVYADSLEKRDPVRAQLIHLQCDLAKLAPWERRAREVRSEIEVLLAEHGDRLRAEMPAIPGVAWGDFAFGFVGGARLADVDALAAAAAALEEQTAVTHVELTSPEGALTDETPLGWMRTLSVRGGTVPDPRLAAKIRELVLVDAYNGCNWLERSDDAPPLRAVTLTGDADSGAEIAAHLAAADWARGVRTLEIPSTYEDDNSGYQDDPRLGANGARALAKLPGLQRLVVDGHRIGGVALGKLCGDLPELRALSARENGVRKPSFGTPPGAQLVDLDLSQNALGHEGMSALLKSARATALEQLVLDTCELESLGIAELVRAPAWQTLRRLVLSRNPLGASSIRELAAAKVPAQLHALELADTDLDDSAGPALAKIAWLGQLSELDLSGNRLAGGASSLRAITGEAMRRLRLASCGLSRSEAVAISRFWPLLVELDLSDNAITDAGLERFAAMKPAPALQHLALRACALTGDGVELLARMRTPRLRTLDLSGNALDAAVVDLLAAPSLRAVQELHLRSCGAATVAALIGATALPPRLATLDLRGNELDEAALLALADAPALAAIRIRLDGNPFVFTEASRARLVQRFGAGWHQDD